MKVAQITSGVRGLASYSLNLYRYFEAHQPEMLPLVVSSVPWTKDPIPCLEPKSRLVGGIYPWPERPAQVHDALAAHGTQVLHHHHPSGRLDFHVKKIATRLDVPLLTTIHMAIGSSRHITDRVMGWYFRLVRNHINYDPGRCAYVAISQFVREQVLRLGGLPADRVVLLYAGVDTERYHPVPRPDTGRLELVFLGQVMPEKGIDVLVDVVEALSETRPVRLRVIGNGHLLKPLMRRTAGDPSFEWLGFTPDPGLVARTLAEAHLTVMPTRWDEAFSYVPLESLSCGTPVLASRAGGTGEIIRHGHNGFLVSPGDGDALLETLEKADIGQLEDMGHRGRMDILARHTLQSFGERYAHLYGNMAERPERLDPLD